MASLKQQPEFEQMESEVAQTETTTVKETSMNTNTTTQDAGVMASTAIAQAGANSAMAVAKAPTKLVQAFADKHAVFDIATVEGLGMAVPRIKGEQGSLFQGDADLGSAIRFEVVSISPRWVIGTGEQDAEAKDFFRISLDNHMISGESVMVEDYLNDLKAQGFDKAKKSEYLDLFGFVVWTEKKGDVEVDQRELVCVQCSPTSKGAWVAFATTRGLFESRGVAKPVDVVEIHAEKRTSGNNRFTNFSFSVPKA